MSNRALLGSCALFRILALALADDLGLGGFGNDRFVLEDLFLDLFLDDTRNLDDNHDSTLVVQEFRVFGQLRREVTS